ncbi:MAG: ATP-binding cassette domain-containing protein [Pirellulaceae bacterium]|nr:ATP-binding cassette domain-containing protein [Pirellulaceae bacterium]HJN09893.1 ATP-binding cassette domain-containing protein [Pirellulaceae bacterium]
MIELCGVTQHYGVRPVLRHIELQIKAGELTAIVGPNGMGKSTLLGVIAGVLSPNKGSSRSLVGSMLLVWHFRWY